MSTDPSTSSGRDPSGPASADTTIGPLAASDSPVPLRTGSIGPYRLLREIGRGGMGVVYLAERADGAFSQRVAVKLLHGFLDDERVLRFRAERQILASLDHPNIARLRDGGTTPDGSPYLVMDYVDGVPIDRYCREQQRSIGDRLRLFTVVCAAVGHAHRNLIVHRDLKPSNIIVSADGVPRLLDFGIAKLLDADDPRFSDMTATGVRLLTPDYAAPEQVRGEPITTATDVYALGGLLFELITDQRPHTFTTLTPTEIERVVCRTDAPRPSSVTPALDGDLDVITLTALQKDPSRRYATVDALRADIQRYLDGQPILARANTWRYLARRFVARHQWPVAAAAAFVILLVGFAVVVSAQAARVARERDVAQQERDTAREVSDFVIGLFEVSNPNEARGNAVSARELLDRGAVRVERDLASQPEIQARMMDTIGRIYVSLGLYDPAIGILDRSLAVRERAFGPRTADRAITLLQRGAAAREKADYATAERLYREALDIRRDVLGPSHPDVADTLNHLGLTLVLAGRHDEGVAALRESIAMSRATLPAGSPRLAIALSNLGMALRQQSKLADALPVLTEAVEIRRKAFAGPHALTANSLMQLGQLQSARGELDEAERLMRESLDMRLQVFEPDHPTLAVTYNNLASLLHDRTDLAAAEPMYRKALELRSKILGPSHPETAVTMNNLATLLEERGDAPGAIALYRQALQIRRTALGEQHPAVARGMHNLGRALLFNGSAAEGTALVEEALARRQQSLGPQHLETLGSLSVLAQARGRQRRFAEAESLFRDAVAGYRKVLPDGHLTTAATLVSFGELLLSQGKLADAEPLFREALAMRSRRLPPGHTLIQKTEALAAKAAARPSR